MDFALRDVTSTFKNDDIVYVYDVKAARALKVILHYTILSLFLSLSVCVFVLFATA